MNISVTSKPPTSFPAHILNISIGKKILMAVTGFFAFGFVFGHMLGNLQIFIGQDQMNTYAEKLKVYAIQYRSQYHFSDHYSTSAYIGSTLGVRYVRQTITGDVQTGSSTSSNSYTRYTDEGNGVVIPIGLRLGVRGALEGGYADIYVGLGYAIGSGAELTTAPFREEESELSSVNFQLGFAFGFGR